MCGVWGRGGGAEGRRSRALVQHGLALLEMDGRLTLLEMDGRLALLEMDGRLTLSQRDVGREP